jgi:hypothetical protein
MSRSRNACLGVLADPAPLSGEPFVFQLGVAANRLDRDLPLCCPCIVLFPLLVPQQDHRIDRQRALRGDPRSNQAKHQHGDNHAAQHPRILRCGLVDYV